MVAATPLAAQADGQETGYFERAATYNVYRNLPEGTDPTEETVAEIVAASPDGMMLAYTDSPGERIGLVDISDIAAPTGAGMIDVGGEPTSVTIIGGNAFVGVNTSESYTEPSGYMAVIDLAAGSITAQCDLGGQPDSIAASPDGAFLAVAIENERDEDLNDGIIPQLPAGNLAIFDVADGAVNNCDAVRTVDLTGLADVAGDDPEPEFVAINADNVAVVTLQENNHLALVDVAAG
ncbi:MAG: alkaline phosphatase, partial [Pseudomonadota bacterium]